MLGIFAALAEFERKLISKRAKAGMTEAWARGGEGGRPSVMTAMANRDTKVGDHCAELGITRQTPYRHVDPKGDLLSDGEKLLCGGNPASSHRAGCPFHHLKRRINSCIYQLFDTSG